MHDAVKLDKSYEVIGRALREQGPFDGLVGFSQVSQSTAIVNGMRQP